jgi:hypothetical protein
MVNPVDRDEITGHMWNRERHDLTRQELYDLVWSEPVYKVAERYAISGVALAKKCRNFGIPLPERGYWNRLQAGKKVRKTPLKPASAGTSEMIVIFQGQGPRPPKPPQPELDPQIVSAIAAERLEKSKIVVPEHVTHLHPQAKKIGDAHSRGRPWNERNAKTEPIELRRRRILHALFRAIEQRKGQVTARPYSAGFEVELLGSTFQMSCSEPIRRKRVPMSKEQLRARSQWETRDYNTVDEPSGILRMRMARENGHPKDMLDTDEAPLETKLNDVMIWLFQHSITVAERDRRAEEARIAAAERARKEREAEIARWKAEDERRKERERVAGLLEEVKQWRAAMEIRDFVKAASKVLDLTTEWKTWALAVADTMDPLRRSDSRRGIGGDDDDEGTG